MVRMTLGLWLVLLGAARTWAAVSITVEPRTELLYSTSKDVDCTALHETDSANLPLNVVRLRALMDGAPIDTSTVRLQWSFKGEAVGLLAADLDLGPTGSLPTVTAMCAEFGNQCALSGSELGTYAEDTIFYVAPTCDDLTRNPARPFGGGTAKIRVKAFAGKRKLGKADATVGFGRNGSATVYVYSGNGFVDGIGRPGGVTTGLLTTYAARVQQPSGVAKPPTEYSVSGDLGSVVLDQSCTGYDACERLQQSGERGIMLLTASFEDGSALCDNIEVVIGHCSADGRLEVIPSPRRTTYDPANASQSLVDLTVRLRNTSKAENGLPPCTFYLVGNIAQCSSTIKVGEFTDTKTAAFSLPHCSATTTLSCATDAQCRPPLCATCQPDEECLIAPYCSTTFTRTCTTDADCAPPACAECQANEICVHMLDFPGGSEIFLEPGTSIDLVTGTAAMRNQFKSSAALTDTWTVNVEIPAMTFTKTLKYKIRSRP